MEYKKPSKRPEIPRFYGFHRIVFYVGNAFQAASYYTSRFGFSFFKYKGLETGHRDAACHVIKNDNIIFEFRTNYNTNDSEGIGEHVLNHGDGVKDIGFLVEDATKMYEIAVSRGAVGVQKPTIIQNDCVISSIKTYGDTIHTFIEFKKDFKGNYIPDYVDHHLKDPMNDKFEPIELNFIDHIVGNMKEKEMEITVEFYEKILDFHRFWSVDDTMMHTEYSALNSIVVSDFDEVIKMPINEPAKGKKKSQIQEYVDYYNGNGVQHIALNVKDIIRTIERMRERGVVFLDVPKSYYDNLRSKIPNLKIEIKEDIDKLEELRILIDYDDKGYLLQLFTKPVEDRPTLFFEIIQRNNHQGFGAGNFKSLFEAIEMEQAKRGNLI